MTLLRPKKSATVASSSDHAEALDEIQYTFGDGPCMTAARTHTVVLVPDVTVDDRWPGYTDAAAAAGIASVLGVPFELDGEAKAALNIYSGRTDAYDQAAVEARAAARSASARRWPARRTARRRALEARPTWWTMASTAAWS